MQSLTEHTFHGLFLYNEISIFFPLLILDAIVLNLTNQYVQLLDKEQLTTREYQP